MSGARANRADDVLLVDATKTTQGAFAVDAHQRIVFWNSTAETLLGYSEAEVLGRRCGEVLKACHGAAPHGCMRWCGQNALPDEAPLAQRFDLAATARDGATRRLSVLALVAHNARGEPRLVHLLRTPESRHEGKHGAEVWNEGRQTRDTAPRGHARMPLADGAQPAQPLQPLTRREHEVLRLLARGLTTPEIADELSISPITARNHVTSVIEKLGVKTRLQAVVVASRRGLL